MTGSRVFFLAVLLAALASSLAAQQRWEIQYLYDDDNSTLTLTDLKFPSAQRGIACGFITRHQPGNLIKSERDVVKPVVLVTSDGGKKWTQTLVKEAPESLDFLDDSIGWMVTESGVWLTEESGRSWRRIAEIRDIDRVLFVTRQKGFAIGPMKRVLATGDGGVTWTKVTAAAEPKTTVEWTAYTSISFPTPNAGLITGLSRPPDRRQLPAWTDPSSQETQREVPHATIFLETKDGGKSWKSSTVSLFGEIIRTSLSSDGVGLGLIQFNGVFPYPSEVYRIDLGSGKSERAFRERNRAITDVLLEPGGGAYLAGYEPPGRISPSPIPGKVKMLHSSDLQTWDEVPVDYRAVGRRVILAAPHSTGVWAATDTGIILRLRDK